MTNEVARALSAEQQITADLAAFVERDGADLEAAHRALAKANDIPEGDITAAWVQARADKVARQRLKARAAEIAVKLEPQPRSLKARMLEISARHREREIALRPVEVVVAKPVAAPAPQFGGEAAPVEGPVVLNARAPYETAKEFARRRCYRDGKPVVWYWQGQFWRWNGKYYEEEKEEVIRGEVYAFLDGASRWIGPNQTAEFQPTPKHVNDLLDGLKTGLALPVECQPPMWLDSRRPATDMNVFQNGIVNMLTGERQELTPNLWVHSALGFEWKPGPTPVWDRWLDEVFPGDEESKQCLEELTGYCMTEETKFQKGGMLLGPKRSGKGTWAHVMRKLVGDRSYVGLSFNTWTQGENSKEVLIGKRVGVFSDVRFKPGKFYGATYDAGGIGHKDAELFLNITGEDTITIGRKWIGAWHGQLRLKLVVISNEVPNLNDSSGVLPSRFVKIRFSVSFYGREA
jgi:putative DNA primase/helicase